MRKRILDIYYVGILILVATLPFSVMLKNIAIIFTLLCWLLLLFKGQETRKSLSKAIASNKGSIFLLLFVFMYIVSVIIHYEQDQDVFRLLKTIEKRTPFLIFPIILSGITLLPNKRILNAFKLYIAVIVGTSILSLIIGLMVTIEMGTMRYISPVDATIQNNFMYHRLTSYLGIHAVYFSASVLFAFCNVLIFYLFEKSRMNNQKRILTVAALTFLGIMMLLLNSLMMVIIFPIVVSIILVYYSRVKKIKIRFSGLSILLIVIVTVSVGVGIYKKFKIEQFESLKSLFQYDLSLKPDTPGSPNQNWNALNIRLAIWEVNGYVLKDHWVLGVGPGNLKETLDKYYLEYDFRFGIINKLNPHNQYIHTFLVLGIGGILIFIVFLTILFGRAIRRKDVLFISLLIILVLFSMSESTLVTNRGIVFFGFFLIFFSYLENNFVQIISEEE